MAIDPKGFNMNATQLIQALESFEEANYQAILDGASMVVIHDSHLGLGKSDQAFVIYELGEDHFSNTAALKAHLIENAESILAEYYQFNPVSREYFQAQLTAQLNQLGEMAFVAMPKQPADYVIFVENGQVVVEDATSPRFKYGLYLSLDQDYQPAARVNKVKNWIQSGTAYGDYISTNVCRFSAME